MNDYRVKPVGPMALAAMLAKWLPPGNEIDKTQPEPVEAGNEKSEAHDATRDILGPEGEGAGRHHQEQGNLRC